jgi:hypothetical protein
MYLSGRVSDADRQKDTFGVVLDAHTPEAYPAASSVAPHNCSVRKSALLAVQVFAHTLSYRILADRSQSGRFIVPSWLSFALHSKSRRTQRLRYTNSPAVISSAIFLHSGEKRCLLSISERRCSHLREAWHARAGSSRVWWRLTVRKRGKKPTCAKGSAAAVIRMLCERESVVSRCEVYF